MTPTTTPEQPALIEAIGAAMREAHPLSLLMMASTIIESFDPRRRQIDVLVAGSATAPLAPVLTEFCDSLIEADLLHTHTLAWVIGELSGDDLMRQRIRRAVLARNYPLVDWVRRLGDTSVDSAIAMTDVLGDGQNIVVDVRLPGNDRMSALVYVDHNMGTVVKDAFVLPGSLDQVREAWALAEESQSELRVGSLVSDLPLVEARARLAQAIAQGAAVLPPFATETWPACKPLVEWALSMIPAGGVGYTRVEVDDAALAALADEFFASDYGRGLDESPYRSMLDSFFRFASEYGSGDPLRWSPVNVEILLVDWLPRKVLAGEEFLRLAPGLLRAVIGFSHTKQQLPSVLTEQTMASVDIWEPIFLETVSSDAHPGRMPAWARDPDYDDVELTDHEYYEFLLDEYAYGVGGPEVLSRLDTKPLPDEAFDWSGIDPDIHDRVAEVIPLIDTAALELFDTEFRTASRRLLARVAVAGPAIFRRRGAANTLAAALVWLVAKANGTVGYVRESIIEPVHEPVLVKDINAHFKTSGSISTRADTVVRALDIDRSFGGSGLGSADVLTASGRARIIAGRDELLQLLQQ